VVAFFFWATLYILSYFDYRSVILIRCISGFLLPCSEFFSGGKQLWVYIRNVGGETAGRSVTGQRTTAENRTRWWETPSGANKTLEPPAVAARNCRAAGH